MKKGLEKFVGKKVYELPEEMIREIRKNFPEYDNVNDLEITTWERFILNASATDGTEDGTFWCNTIKNNLHLWIYDGICIVKLNILEMPDVSQIMADYDDNWAIVDWGEPMLIIDADDSEYGYGYIGVEVLSSNVAGEEGTAQLVLDITTRKKAFNELTKRKDLNDPENYKKAVEVAKACLESVCIFLREGIDIKSISHQKRKDWIKLKVGFFYDKEQNIVEFTPNHKICLLVAKEAEHDLIAFEALREMIVTLREHKIPMPECFENFLTDCFSGKIKKPKKRNMENNFYINSIIAGIVGIMRCAWGFYPTICNEVKRLNGKGYCILSAISEASEQLKDFEYLSYDALYNSIYKKAKIYRHPSYL